MCKRDSGTSQGFKGRTNKRWEGRAHLLFQLGLGQQLRDEVKTDMDGGDACHSERQQTLRVTLRERHRRQRKQGTLISE